MKICIIKPDGSNAEILLSEQQPTLENTNNEILLFENYHYKLIVRDDEIIDNLELFVGDYSIPLTLNMQTNCFETNMELIFSGCFDLVCINAYCNDEYGNEKAYYSDFLRIATTKQTAKQVEQMLEEIEASLPNFLEICFSRSRKKSGVIKNDSRSIWNTLKIIDEIINIYEGNYGYFSNHKKACVEQVVSIVDAKDMRVIDQDSLRWIVCNPDNLIRTDKDSGIKVEDYNYIPSKIKTYISQYSYDVYENKAVLGFLKSIIDYIDDQIMGFDKEMSQFENIPERIVMQLPNTHELTGRCIYIYYRGVIKRFVDKRDLLQDIFYKYERVLGCLPYNVFDVPKLTNTFKQVFYYRLCYECMVKWFEAGDYSFDHLNYLFKLKTLSRIFEYYCLIKIQLAISKCGYTIQETDRIVYNIEEGTEDINNYYLFSGRGEEITLLYEPSIWVDKTNERVNLYSTGYNFSKGKWNDRWTPDFILKIHTERKDYYYILDAKYSNAQNVKKRYLPDLVLKYGAQIASKDSFFSDVIGVGALYPSDEDNIYYFKKNLVNSKKISLPMYFSLTIVGDNSGNIALKDQLFSLLEIIEIIESEVSDNDRASVTQRINRDVEKGLQTASDFRPDGLESKNDVEDSIIIKVNGKKCFYNAKSMCLFQKKMCMVSDSPCEHYVNKNSRALLKDASVCRNFIQHLRKGKVYRVECSVSGLPGCVGPDECKFCLRKNKNKK